MINTNLIPGQICSGFIFRAFSVVVRLETSTFLWISEKLRAPPYIRKVTRAAIYQKSNALRYVVPELSILTLN